MNYMNLAEAKDKLSQLIKDSAETTEPVTITVHGRKEAVLISLTEYESLLETIQILKNQKLVKKIAGALNEVKQGRVVSFKVIKKDA
ncbi:MAG: hypothetical protein A3G33_04225 [Omnitrophica bacterium RIFCSPLOWO2_12_FULL_44_17]|uniref:Antitoxin n=1 Tax=Candidatus Danuiimicrobium aquiferis TaxID=1801832 RepID=A0A1G1KQB0_9BACT|nr:MAG: hypothetical protein A3B72_10430 [Omnitrophica bacterium RIFCSPHIGHO2_02_FULL_45_28]OGW89543.1 MAG: hypothetical protein A3E74_07970 [Omnitrophica bacterium RIFCSPHIGHO2_12_FULL_44_12]OGW95144.1 MAG: hypothetical protein A3G33_04225 [Omnitrophica bacterium RIFCSPLOWO2_12_FULL_44_17]OGX01712.1 MAG: hypothetical protein A3J12_04215 [Omnitrophica bacterium RIFCSPLOWO2_02_FULL_44_11]